MFHNQYYQVDKVYQLHLQMTSYKAHHMFHDFVPKPINRIAYNDVSHKMAVARFVDICEKINFCYVDQL